MHHSSSRLSVFDFVHIQALPCFLVCAVDTVRSSSSFASQNGELATASGTNNLLASDGSVVDESGLLNVFNSALTSLVVTGKAPGVGLTVASNSKAVVRSGSD